MGEIVVIAYDYVEYKKDNIRNIRITSIGRNATKTFTPTNIQNFYIYD